MRTMPLTGCFSKVHVHPVQVTPNREQQMLRRRDQSEALSYLQSIARFLFKPPGAGI